MQDFAKSTTSCDLFSYKEVIVKKYFIVTMYMMLKGFRKFMSENYVSYIDNKEESIGNVTLKSDKKEKLAEQL